MFARVTRFSGTPEQIGSGLRLYREQAIPWLEEASGFRGFVALVNPEGGRSMGITFWTTEEAAAESGGPLRDLVAEHTGTTMDTLEVFEVAFVESLDLSEID